MTEEVFLATMVALVSYSAGFCLCAAINSAQKIQALFVLIPFVVWMIFVLVKNP